MLRLTSSSPRFGRALLLLLLMMTTLSIIIDSCSSLSSPSGTGKDRRRFLQQVISASSLACITSTTSVPSPAIARGLVQFPCVKPLANTYHFLRAGTTLLEEDDILSTNPLFLTNREAALSPKGSSEIEAVCSFLERSQIDPSVIKYSFAASSMDSAKIVADRLHVGQNQVVPEFNFMDPRAIGKWDMMPISQVLPAIIAMDDLQATKDGTGGRPPPNDDGTPNETLEDNSIRLAQLMAVMETQYAGDNVVLIFPDGTSPALLSAMIAGIPFNKAHVLEYEPGEIRIDVTRKSTLELFEKLQRDEQESEKYAKLVERGDQERKRLLSMKQDQLVSKKDRIIEQERIEMEEKLRRKEQERLAREEQDRESRLLRQQELEGQRRAQRLRKEEQANAKKRQKQQRTQQKETAIRSQDSSNDGSDGDQITTVLSGVALGGLALAVAGLSSNDENGPVEPSLAKSITNEQVLQEALAGESLLDIDDESSPVLDNATSVEVNSLPSGNEQAKDQTSLYSEMPKDVTPVIMEEEDRKTLAQNAMEDYLNQDDGGEAWLQSLGQIIQEVDND